VSVALYMDVHVQRAVTIGLRLRGVDVLTSQQDGTLRLDDDKLLDRALALGRVFFTQDDDLLKEAATRQRSARRFGGLIYAHQQNITVSRTIDDLELIAKVYRPDELENRVIFLPLK
jgi:hypothetical protein